MFSKLLQPGESVDFSAGGSWVRVDAGSKVQVVTGNGHRAQLYERDSAQFTPFREITVTNKSAAAETISIRVSTGQIVGAGDGDVVALESGTEVAINSEVVITRTPDNESPDTPDITIPAGQTVKIHDPAVYSCAAVEFYAGEANTLNLRVWPGGDGVTVQGGILAPGGAGEYSGELAIWAHNAGGTDQIINLTKLKRV